MAAGRERYSSRNRRIGFVCVALAGCALVGAGVAWVATEPLAGIVVEEVRAGTAGQKAGLRQGDVLVSWRREPVPAAGLPGSGGLAAPFDLAEVLLEQMPRAQVTLLGRRGTEEMSWELPAGAPSELDGIRTKPVLPEDLLALGRRARVQMDTRFDDGAATLRSAVAAARSHGAPGAAVWLLADAARRMGLERRWEEADALYQEALSLDAARGTPAVAAQLYREWGDLFRQRFAWDRAQECYERALAEDRKKGFDSLGESRSLIGLGSIDLHSGGSKDEAELYRQAIGIRERLAPGSADHALGWMEWGHAAGKRAHWPDAVARYRQALEILPEHGASRLTRAEALAVLAYVLGQNGEAGAAEKAWRQSHALVTAEAPEDFLVVGITQGIGLMEAAKGDLARAEELLAGSHQLCRRLRPGSLDEADTLQQLGLLQMRAGKREAGSANLCEALDVVESWSAKLRARQDTRHWWGRLSAEFHRDCAESLAELGRSEPAFAAIERGRARAFLDLLAERGLRLAALAPERGAQWRQLNAEYGRAQDDLRRAGARSSTLEEIVNLEGRLREIRRQKERLLERDLPLGSVRYPQALGLAEARRSLEPGTALLLYSTGTERTLLFVLLPEGAAVPPGMPGTPETPGWAVLTLDAGYAELTAKVKRFREALVRERFNPRASEGPSKALYDLLVRPAEPWIAGAERVVLAPDGPLHTLPFAALSRGGQYLVEWKPLHFTLSATAYAEQRSHRPSPGAPVAAPKVVAFGDPLYAPLPPEEALKSADHGLRQVFGQAVVPLPSTREEVQGIAGLFPGARILLGGQVHEDEVKQAVRGASLIHFAVHGVLNGRNPQDSALVLSPVPGPGARPENSLLQAWEVMESLPLEADLVTLSACDTALGREVGGEGLVGLTRAFQYAGARSVVATLWGISDRSTADFMKKFYGALQEGKTKDVALRAAQIAQIRSNRPQPFYWAAFQLFGDWR